MTQRPGEEPVGLYAVMGSPVAHSISPDIHARFAEQADIRLCYQTIDTGVNGLADTLAHFKKAGGLGANVTIPCKQDAWELAGLSSKRSERAQAANTLWWDSDDVLCADNTDGIGLMRDIQNNLGFALHERHVLLLGAGGAARGILGPILDAHPATVDICNRTATHAEKLVSTFIDDGPVRLIRHCRLTESAYDVIINCTSTGLTNTLPAILPEKMPSPSLCYDLAYNCHADTAFVAWGKQQGAKVSADGLGMLVEQAAESFFLWHGRRPTTIPVLTKLREQRNSR